MPWPQWFKRLRDVGAEPGLCMDVILYIWGNLFDVERLVEKAKDAIMVRLHLVDLSSRKKVLVWINVLEFVYWGLGARDEIIVQVREYIYGGGNNRWQVIPEPDPYGFLNFEQVVEGR